MTPTIMVETYSTFNADGHYLRNYEDLGFSPTNIVYVSKMTRYCQNKMSFQNCIVSKKVFTSTYSSLISKLTETQISDQNTVLNKKYFFILTP